jgi:hypothetical protein
MSDATGSSDDGEDYAYGDSHISESKRYPVHDCCELEDAEALRVSAKRETCSERIGSADATFLAVFTLGDCTHKISLIF